MALPRASTPSTSAGPQARGAGPEAGRGVRATWRYTVASIVVYSVFTAIVDTLWMLRGGGPGLQPFDALIIALALVALLALLRYCWFFRRGLGAGLPERRYTLWLVVPPAALWWVGLAQPHTVWFGALPIWFAVNALMVVVPGRVRLWLLGGGLAALVLHGVLGGLLGHVAEDPALGIGELVSVGIYIAMTPLVFVAGIWWWEIVVRLDDSRRTSGELAIAQERLRFAADLHDIQGHHLQVIALKTELAGRLLDAEPDAARVQIDEAQQLARTALEDTRALVHGYRAVSLAVEAANAADVLGAAGISCSVDVDGEGLPPGLRTLFGLVIREATTNILRHSEAGTVQLRLERTGDRCVLVARNDGVARDDGVARTGGERAGGSGIDGLRRRFEAVGGSVTAGARGGTFVLRAGAPLTAGAPLAAAPAAGPAAAPEATAGERGRA